MQVKVVVALFAIFMEVAIARRCLNRPICYDGPMLPIRDCEYDSPLCCDLPILPQILDCGCMRPMYCDEAVLEYGPYYEMPMFPLRDCGCVRPCCDRSVLPPMECGCFRPGSRELVLPPLRAELPLGLGYFSSAVPLVSTYFRPAVEVGVCAGASVPVTSPCSCLTLATPVSPDIAPLVRPIIL